MTEAESTAKIRIAGRKKEEGRRMKGQRKTERRSESLVAENGREAGHAAALGFFSLYFKDFSLPLFCGRY
ncbi:hypothetical protein SLEP1_g53917 [Rubroshorea leprosula]|uniref:Uncharacterized protein n=1 Tax=Rubroshorea leprosula TaxID=152421 RepID=A0AAV5MEQ2_9ROSI|nr:hypothetical protein SLEP1_g53917 [Rubroshorea leprosula]